MTAIEVVTFTRDGRLLDRASAADAEAAVVAARTLIDDATAAGAAAPTASFYANDKLVRAYVKRAGLGATPAKGA